MASPEGATVSSLGRKPQDSDSENAGAPKARQGFCRPLGAFIFRVSPTWGSHPRLPSDAASRLMAFGAVAAGAFPRLWDEPRAPRGVAI